MNFGPPIYDDNDPNIKKIAEELGITPQELIDFLNSWANKYPDVDIPKDPEELKSAYRAYKKRA